MSSLFFRLTYRLKGRKNGGFRANPLAKFRRLSFFVRFSFNGCRLTIAVCRYKMQASQISCAGAYRQYGTKQDCRIAPYFIGRNRRIVERKPSSLRIFGSSCTPKCAMYPFILALPHAHISRSLSNNKHVWLSLLGRIFYFSTFNRILIMPYFNLYKMYLHCIF